MASETWKSEVLQAHNSRRQLHGSPPLKWSDECFHEALLQANACQGDASTSYGQMSATSARHGQNIFGCGTKEPSVDEAVQAWYGESKDYDYSCASFSSQTGHFTQMLWKGVTSVGMAVSDDSHFLVAVYSPAGNTAGEFRSNVLPLQASPAKGKRKASRGFAGSPIKSKRQKGLSLCPTPVRHKKVAICKRPSCNKPTWNGRAGEYCTKQVWSATFASCHHFFV